MWDCLLFQDYSLAGTSNWSLCSLLATSVEDIVQRKHQNYKWYRQQLQLATVAPDVQSVCVQVCLCLCGRSVSEWTHNSWCYFPPRSFYLFIYFPFISINQSNLICLTRIHRSQYASWGLTICKMCNVPENPPQKPQGQTQVKDPSPRTDRSAIDVACSREIYKITLCVCPWGRVTEPWDTSPNIQKLARIPIHICASRRVLGWICV